MQLKQHLINTTRLAIPLIISQIGHIFTGVVDTIFLGKLGAISTTTQAAGVLANQMLILLNGILAMELKIIQLILFTPLITMAFIMYH